MLDEVENTIKELDNQKENEEDIKLTQLNEEKADLSNKSSLEERISEKISTKETKSIMSDKKEEPSSDSESEESSKKSEKSYDSEKSEEKIENVIDYKNLKGLNLKDVKNKENNSNFYEKRITEKKMQEKKLELIRKKNEDEAKSLTKIQINAESKKIMDKKQGFVKPIYQRAKEIEETKKIKIDTLKKTQDEKKAKKEEEVVKSKLFDSKKQYDEKEFSNWRNHTLEWESKKKLKIHNQKDELKKQEVEIHSKYYHPNINKKSDKSKNENENISVHEKLYNMKDDRQNKLMQKIVESFPDFKPKINKKYPNYFKKNLENNHIQSTNESTPSKTKTNYNSNNSNNINNDINHNYKTVNLGYPKSERQKGKNTSMIENDFVNPLIILSEDEEIEEIKESDDIIKQYKQALETTNDIIKKESRDNFINSDKDDKNNDKINKYSHKLAGIVNNLTKS